MEEEKRRIKPNPKNYTQEQIDGYLEALVKRGKGLIIPRIEVKEDKREDQKEKLIITYFVLFTRIEDSIKDTAEFNNKDNANSFLEKLKETFDLMKQAKLKSIENK